MVVEISRHILDAIICDARATPGLERCGLLLGKCNRILDFCPCDNISPDPACAFEINPGQLITAHVAARKGGPQVVGNYHYHPNGVLYPSATDAEHAQASGEFWLIVTQHAHGLWRTAENGAIHGRFDAVALAVRI